MGLIARFDRGQIYRPVNAQARRDVIADDTIPAWKQKRMIGQKRGRSAPAIDLGIKEPRIVSVNGKKVGMNGNSKIQTCVKCGCSCLDIAKHLKIVHGIG